MLGERSSQTECELWKGASYKLESLFKIWVKELVRMDWKEQVSREELQKKLQKLWLKAT